ncbi:MAG: asparaginase [Alphaproteobacteria bacterium]|nr:asparaginase [Alphaproteobacteria bacterium]
MDNPILVEVTRGALVESRHRAAVAVTDAHGRVVLSVGNVGRPVYPRSAIKPIQALPLIETGAAETFGVTEAEIALACSSHNGEVAHVDIVTAWLRRLGLSVGDLECGASLPATEAAQRALFASGGRATAAHDNCSGKHAGFLTVAKRLGAPTRGYVGYAHPVQQRVLGVLEQMTELDLGEAPRGTDGCGIPVIGIPLGNLALAMARLAYPHDQPEARQAACVRVRRAMAAHPFLVAGTGRFCTRVIEASGGRVLAKTGAEGVYCAALPEAGLGIALKIDDGTRRAAELLTGAVLGHLGALDAAARTALADALHPAILSRAGLPVGEIRLAAGAPFDVPA